MILGTGAKECDSLVQRLEKPLLARGAVTSAVIAMPVAFRRCWAIVLMLLCLCASSWAECFTTRSWGNCLQQCPSNCISPPFRDWCNSNNNSSYLCNYPDCNPNQLLGCSDNISFNTGSHIGTFSCVIVGVEENSGMSSNNVLGGCGANNPTTICCGTQAEADSVKCEMNPDLPGCAPQIDSTACDEYRSECESLGGKFTGNPVSSDVSETGCLSFCDMCNSVAQNNYRRALANICCSQGKAPPAEITSCVNNELTGDPDMSFSNFDCDNQGGFDCDCQDVSSDNAEVYNSVCNENQWEEPNEGSGSEESSSSSESSENASSGSGEDWEYDYSDSLHKIKMYDSLTWETNRSILACLTSPSLCASNSESSLPDYSGSLTDIKTDIKKLDTTVNNSINSLKGSISDGNDSLIDSIRKFISMNSFSFSGDTLGDSLGKIHGTLSSVFGLLNGNGSQPDLNQDYGGFGSAELDGKNLADSIRGAIGFDGLDSINIDGRFQAGLDSANSGSYDLDSIDLQNLHDSLGNALVNQVKNDRDHLPDTLNKYADSLIAVAPFSMFDSLIYSTLGRRIPNTNECPDGCFKWSVNLPKFGLVNFTIDYGVCLGRVPLGGMNALSFIRLIVRLFVVVACIWIVVWNFTRKKG